MSDLESDAGSDGQLYLRSDAGTPLSLDKEYFGMDFANRSWDSLVRSLTPSDSELDDLSDADEDKHIVIEEDLNFTP